MKKTDKIVTEYNLNFFTKGKTVEDVEIMDGHTIVRITFTDGTSIEFNPHSTLSEGVEMDINYHLKDERYLLYSVRLHVGT